MTPSHPTQMDRHSSEMPKSDEANLTAPVPSEGAKTALQARARQSLRHDAFAKVGAELFLERISDDTALVRLHIGNLSFGIGQPRNGTEAASVLRTFRDALTDLLMAANESGPQEDHPCERGAREALVDELLGVMDQCKAAGMAAEVAIIKRAAVWIDPDAPIDQEPAAIAKAGARA